MKLLAAWAVSVSLAAGLVLGSIVLVSAASAQTYAANGADQARLSKVSDVDGPYTGAPPPPPAPPPAAYGYGPGYGYPPPPYGYGPPLMPPQEVYAVLRDNGFSPLGIPRQRGVTYVIAAMDRGGEDGRLVIDARNGRIIRFVPASRWGAAYDRMGYDMGPPPYPAGPMPAPIVIRGAPTPPAPIPRVAGRTVPVPTAKPNVAARPAEPAQPSAVAEAKPAPQAAAPSSQPNVAVSEAKPAPQILPTQKMPAAQGLE
jgi:hypothetical protein